uniref:Uncharacterized protein n=1 Tax=Rhodnius prolixus TaxID=13249 RepID=T1HTQ8_RHOPR
MTANGSQIRMTRSLRGHRRRISAKCTDLLDLAGPYMQAWKRGIAILTAGSVKVSPDERFRLVDGYNLEIRDVQTQDAGNYVCQIATLQPLEITHTVEILALSGITCLLAEHALSRSCDFTRLSVILWDQDRVSHSGLTGVLSTPEYSANEYLVKIAFIKSLEDKLDSLPATSCFFLLLILASHRTVKAIFLKVDDFCKQEGMECGNCTLVFVLMEVRPRQEKNVGFVKKHKAEGNNHRTNGAPLGIVTDSRATLAQDTIYSIQNGPGVLKVSLGFQMLK